MSLPSCLDALEGATTPDVAREAFITAALAARIHIRSNEDPRDAVRKQSNAMQRIKPSVGDQSAEDAVGEA